MSDFVSREALANANVRIRGNLRHNETHYGGIDPKGKIWVVPKKSSRVPPYLLGAAQAAIVEYGLHLEGVTIPLRLDQLRHAIDRK